MEEVQALETIFAQVEGPRIERTKRHRLRDILIIAICGTICGAEGWVEIEEFGKAKAAFFQELLDFGPAKEVEGPASYWHGSVPKTHRSRGEPRNSLLHAHEVIPLPFASVKNYARKERVPVWAVMSLARCSPFCYRPSENK